MKKNISIVGSGVGSISALDALNKSDKKNFRISLFSKNHKEAGYAYKDSPGSFIMNTRLDSLIQFNNVIEINDWLIKNIEDGVLYSSRSFIPRAIYGRYLLDVSSKLRKELTDDGVEINFYGKTNYIDADGNINIDSGVIKTTCTLLSIGFGSDPFKDDLVSEINNVPKMTKFLLLVVDYLRLT